MVIRYFEKAMRDKLEAIRQSRIAFALLKNELHKYDKRCKSLSAEEFDYLVKNYGTIPIEDIASRIKRKPSSLRNIAKDLFLSVRYLKKGEISLCSLFFALVGRYSDSYNLSLSDKYGLPYRLERDIKVVNLTEFFKWLEKHKRLIVCHSYTEGSLPIEPDWFIEKAQADRRAYEYIHKRSWSAEEDNRLRQLVSERKGYKDISRTLKRTGSAIKRRCYDLGISKPKRYPPKLWTDAECNKCKELWLKGYEPCIIAEELDKSDRQVLSMLERNKYYGEKPLKYSP